MTVRTELQPSIASAPGRRNAQPALPSLAGSRARSRHAGPPLLVLAWVLSLAFFLFAVFIPAAVMHRQVEEARVSLASQGP